MLLTKRGPWISLLTNRGPCGQLSNYFCFQNVFVGGNGEAAASTICMRLAFIIQALLITTFTNQGLYKHTPCMQASSIHFKMFELWTFKSDESIHSSDCKHYADKTLHDRITQDSPTSTCMIGQKMKTDTWPARSVNTSIVTSSQGDNFKPPRIISASTNACY
jgi:hypothetical protein